MEALVERPLAEGAVERSVNEKVIVEGSVVEDWKFIKLYLNDWELKIYGKVHIQIVHCFSISVVYQILELKILILMH